MSDQKIIMYDSPEAATYRTDIKGWVSRDGLFYGDNGPSAEHGARWSGCTHMTCECGNVHEKGRVRCRSCQAKIDSEKYYALPLVEWDEVTPVSDEDKYWFDKESLMDDMYFILEDAKERGEQPELQLVLCKPIYLHMLETDIWEDELPEDEEPSDEVCAALDALNAVLKAQGPASWYPDKKRIDMEALWAELKADLAKEIADGKREG